VNYAKPARMAALRILAGKTVGDIDSVGPLAKLKEKEQAAVRIPGSTERGRKEALTKRLKLKMPKMTDL